MIPQTPKTVILAVVVFIGVLTLALIAGAVLLLLDHDQVPGEIWTLAGGGMGGLTALLASTRAFDTPTAAPAPATSSAAAPGAV